MRSKWQRAIALKRSEGRECEEGEQRVPKKVSSHLACLRGRKVIIFTVYSLMFGDKYIAMRMSPDSMS